MNRGFQHAATRHPAARATRRDALRRLTSFVRESPLGGGGQDQDQDRDQAPRRPHVIAPPEYSPEIMAPINLHEFEDVAKRTLAQPAYDYIAAGAADELTLRANREAFDRYWIRRRVMVDTSVVDTSVQLLGQTLEHPILLGPAGAKQLLHPEGDEVTARAARQTQAIYVGASPSRMAELARTAEAPTWWAASLGHATQAEAQDYARRVTDAGAAAISLSVDYPYTGARDRPSRHQWDPEWLDLGHYSTPEAHASFQAGMLDPYTPSLTWEWLDWVHAATDLPILVKGIVTGEDARLAVERGVEGVVVSNHGARTLDGMGGTLDVLPEVVDAVGGRVPVLVDGGVRRGGDVVKALGLGATAILIGRPYLWGLGAFGQEGVQRVVELLRGELRVALGLSGSPTAGEIDRSLIRRAWKARS